MVWQRKEVIVKVDMFQTDLLYVTVSMLIQKKNKGGRYFAYILYRFDREMMLQ